MKVQFLYSDLMNFIRVVKFLRCNGVCAHRMYVGNVTVGEVRKILTGKLHHPHYSFSLKYVLIPINTSVKQTKLLEIRVFLKNNCENEMGQASYSRYFILKK